MPHLHKETDFLFPTILRAEKTKKSFEPVVTPDQNRVFLDTNSGRVAAEKREPPLSVRYDSDKSDYVDSLSHTDRISNFDYIKREGFVRAIRGTANRALGAGWRNDLQGAGYRRMDLRDGKEGYRGLISLGVDWILQTVGALLRSLQLIVFGAILTPAMLSLYVLSCMLLQLNLAREFMDSAAEGLRLFVNGILLTLFLPIAIALDVLTGIPRTSWSAAKITGKKVRNLFAPKK